MEKNKSVFRTNVVYGVLVLVPSAIIVLLLAKIVEVLDEIAEPLQLQSAVSVVLAIVLALIFLLAVCFIVGAFVRTRIGSWSMERFERTILNQIPGFAIISNVLKGFAEKRTAYRAALVRLHGPGTAVMGFVMEENENDSLTVFVPAVPTMTVGSLHVVDRERVTILENSSLDVTNCISQWGIGSQKIIGNIKV